MNLHCIREGVRIAKHGIRTRFRGPTRYPGNAAEICQEIVETCWDETLGIFITSAHNYPIFYARDFGMCVDSLLALGHGERVRRTLAWALERYEKAGKITQQINRDGKAFNFPDCESPDAYAFLLHALAALDDKRLIRKHRGFISKDLRRLLAIILDEKTGLVQQGVHLGGMRDYALRDSSCYDNVMLAAIKKGCGKLGIESGLEGYDYEKLLVERFWTGKRFKDDLRNKEMTGDANVLPFWFRVLPKKREKKMFTAVLEEIRKRRLDRPFALRYEPHRNSSTKMRWLDSLAGGWERDTVWLHLGNLFLQAVARHDKKIARSYLQEHEKLIERERNYPEVLDKDGRPHTSLLFHSDDSMLWACNFLEMTQRFPRE